MKWLELLVKALPSIIQLAGLAESAFKDRPKSGPEKKALVMAGTKALIDGVQAVSTGGQRETWERIEKPISNIIDNVAEMAFPK